MKLNIITPENGCFILSLIAMVKGDNATNVMYFLFYIVISFMNWLIKDINQ